MITLAKIHTSWVALYVSNICILYVCFKCRSAFIVGLGLAGSLVGIVVNLLVVVAVRTVDRYQHIHKPGTLYIRVQ
jgi:hypothetical protein